MYRTELLSPAGDFERLASAITFGADAIYLGGKSFGMRASTGNFTEKELEKAVAYAHAHHKPVYLTCNTIPLNEEIDLFPTFIKMVKKAKVDAVIVSDMGILSMVKEYAPNMEVHISTQAGIVNYASANAFYQMGAKRVVLARELSLDDIARIRDKTNPNLDIEVFVHGAMCMSFSGRCLLSNYMVGRDANRGECAQPCRWGYHIVEEKRPNQPMPIIEDEKGTYILNAKDLCMIAHIDQVIKAGVYSLKIEGRAKSLYYVSTITNAYRMAIDQFMKNPDHFELESWIKEETKKVSHRQYSTGFFFNKPHERQYYENSGYIRNYDIVAIVNKWEDGMLYCTQRNRFFLGDTIEILEPKKKPIIFTVTELYNEKCEAIKSANHAMMKLQIPYKERVEANAILRKKTSG